MRTAVAAAFLVILGLTSAQADRIDVNLSAWSISWVNTQILVEVGGVSTMLTDHETYAVAAIDPGETADIYITMGVPCSRGVIDNNGGCFGSWNWSVWFSPNDGPGMILDSGSGTCNNAMISLGCPQTLANFTFTDPLPTQAPVLGALFPFLFILGLLFVYLILRNACEKNKNISMIDRIDRSAW
jgi:hypothetical protein